MDSIEISVKEQSQPLNQQEFNLQLDIVRSKWEFAACCQFFQLFGSEFEVDFDSFELEKMLINKDFELVELLSRMFRNSSKNRFVLADTFMVYLAREFVKNDIDLGITEETQFSSLGLDQRMFILYYICELQFERPEGFRILNDFDEVQAAVWRVEPIGKDSNGNTYFLFDDSRLYREYIVETKGAQIEHSKRVPTSPVGSKSPKKVQEIKKWELVCATEHDWQLFPDKFKDSKETVDRSLYRYLTSDLLPLVFKDIQVFAFD